MLPPPPRAAIKVEVHIILEASAMAGETCVPQGDNSPLQDTQYAKQYAGHVLRSFCSLQLVRLAARGTGAQPAAAAKSAGREWEVPCGTGRRSACAAPGAVPDTHSALTPKLTPHACLTVQDVLALQSVLTLLTIYRVKNTLK